MRRTLLALALLAGVVAGGRALAISQWWAPQGSNCPTFDSEESCEAWCAVDNSRCSGTGQCSAKMGPQETKPSCNGEP